MPVRNAARTLDEAVRSITTQTETRLELIAVDDHSTDDSRALLERFRHRDTRVRILDSDGDGIVDALNTGLRAARAPLVARMDADDRSMPRRLEAQLAYHRTRRTLSVVSCLVECVPRRHVLEGYRIYETWLNALREPEDIHRNRFVESPLPHPSVLYRRDTVLALGGYRDHGLPEDYDLWLRLAARGHRFGKVPEVLLEWRESPERLSRTDARYRIERFLELKALHLASGPLRDRSVTIWGAGPIGRRLGRHLIAQGAAVRAFVDIDPKKIGRTRRGRPIEPPETLAAHPEDVVIAAVGSRTARVLIRRRLLALGRKEGRDFWCAA